MSIGKQQTQHWGELEKHSQIRIAILRHFFIGAAIENAMAEEIYQQLNNNTLSNGANLTNEEQVVSLCDWLIKI